MLVTLSQQVKLRSKKTFQNVAAARRTTLRIIFCQCLIGLVSAVQVGVWLKNTVVSLTFEYTSIASSVTKGPSNEVLTSNTKTDTRATDKASADRQHGLVRAS